MAITNTIKTSSQASGFRDKCKVHGADWTFIQEISIFAPANGEAQKHT